MNTLPHEINHAITTPNAGFGLGLRTAHYNDLLGIDESNHALVNCVDWLEIITDNFLVAGGKPLVMLDKFADKYPLVMHGVAMSLGQTAGLDGVYLQRVKQLAKRINPLWISDHLCWTGNAQANLHDLNPLPYTDEAASVLIRNIAQAQDVLGRRLVIENVSSYVTFGYSAQTEWQFLSHVLNESDSLLLLDVNNVYVSSRNHGFVAMDYIMGLPARRIQQIHLAGHSDNGSHIVDTHDHPVCQGVWDLYGEVCAAMGAVATMIERDDHIPPLNELLAELNIAKQISATRTLTHTTVALPEVIYTHTPETSDNLSRSQKLLPNITAPSLPTLQNDWVQYVLQEKSEQAEAVFLNQHIAATPATITTDTAAQRLGIYHYAYRARLAEVLGNHFEKTRLYMGSDTFHDEGFAFVVAHPPRVNSLNQYGSELPAWFKQRYPHNPELHELAQLEWDLRRCFDVADVSTLKAELAAQDTAQAWLSTPALIRPDSVLRPITYNIVKIWQAIHADTEVPEATVLIGDAQGEGRYLLVWRKDLQPHFKSLDAAEAAFLQHLQAGHSIVSSIDLMSADHASVLSTQLGGWLSEWLNDGILLAVSNLSDTTAGFSEHS
jgi:uncharacterized protein (UPF0276 family)